MVMTKLQQHSIEGIFGDAGAAFGFFGFGVEEGFGLGDQFKGDGQRGVADRLERREEIDAFDVLVF